MGRIAFSLTSTTSSSPNLKDSPSSAGSRWVPSPNFFFYIASKAWRVDPPIMDLLQALSITPEFPLHSEAKACQQAGSSKTLTGGGTEHTGIPVCWSFCSRRNRSAKAGRCEEIFFHQLYPSRFFPSFSVFVSPR